MSFNDFLLFFGQSDASAAGPAATAPAKPAVVAPAKPAVVAAAKPAVVAAAKPAVVAPAKPAVVVPAVPAATAPAKPGALTAVDPFQFDGDGAGGARCRRDHDSDSDDASTGGDDDRNGARSGGRPRKQDTCSPARRKKPVEVTAVDIPRMVSQLTGMGDVVIASPPKAQCWWPAVWLNEDGIVAFCSHLSEHTRRIHQRECDNGTHKWVKFVAPPFVTDIVCLPITKVVPWCSELVRGNFQVLEPVCVCVCVCGSVLHRETVFCGF